MAKTTSRAFDGAGRVTSVTAYKASSLTAVFSGQSGYGVGGIPDTMREMTEEKMIVFRM